MHEVLALRNSFPSPASRVAEPIEAFHFPSGEHGSCLRQGTLPWFGTSKGFTALPTLAAVVVLMEYRASTLDTATSVRLVFSISRKTGCRCARYNLSPANSWISSDS